jgi:hypothetical protein
VSRTIKKVVDVNQAEIDAELLKSDSSIRELVVVDVREAGEPLDFVIVIGPRFLLDNGGGDGIMRAGAVVHPP